MPQDRRILDLDTKALSFRQAELRSELTRVRALLAILGVLLAFGVIHGISSWARGRWGEAWPFVLGLGLMMIYEAAWLRFIRRAIDSGSRISWAIWKSSVCIESLLLTATLVFQIHAIGLLRAPTSPLALAYVLFILLSTLRLDSGLSRLSGVFSAAGYGGVAIYVALRFPQAAGGDRLLSYATSFSCAALLLLGGFAAGAVAHRIREGVFGALRDAEDRAKFARDRAIARSIQQGLLPKAPPKIDGFDIAGWNQPATEPGGDYFDWQELSDGQFAFMIADVTGHGIDPTLCMSASRAYVRAGLAATADLGDFLASLNQLLCQDLPSENFVTMAVALLDPDEATLELISAGHGPLLFYLSAEDRFRSYDAQGLPLGLLPHFQYGSPQLMKFAHGDILVFVTDGFIDWANANDEDFGQMRLEEVIRANRGMTAATIISELYSAVSKFTWPMPQPDDLTVIVMKRDQQRRRPGARFSRKSRSGDASQESQLRETCLKDAGRRS